MTDRSPGSNPTLPAPAVPAWSYFLVPLAIGVFLRLFCLTRQPIWVDESLTLRAASIGLPFRFADVLANPAGPLPGVWLRAWTQLFGTGDLALRLWAATAGIAGLILAAFAFRRVLPRAALAATWLLALSPFHIWYSQEVRNYALLLAAAALVLWSLVRALERPGPGAWLVHAAALGLALLCNLSALVLFPVIGLYLLLDRRDRLLSWLGAAMVAGLVIAPWLVVEFRRHVEWSGVGGSGTGPVRGDLTFSPLALPFAYASFLGGFGLGPPLRALHDRTAFSMFVPYLPVLAVAAAGAAVALVLAARGLGEPRLRLLFLWAFLPAVGIAAVAAVGLKAFNARYLAVSQPVFLLLLAEGWGRARARGRVLAWALAAALVVPMLVGWGRQTFDPRYAKEDFRGAAAYLDRESRPGDLIVEEGVEGPLLRYYRGAAAVFTYFPLYFEGPRGGETKLDDVLAGHRRAWWVGSRLWYTDPNLKVLAWLRARGTPVGTWNRGGVRIEGFDLEGERPR